MKLYDMHCHVDLISDMNKFVCEAKQQSIGIVAVTTTPKAYAKEIELFRNATNIKVALGLHPQLIGDRYKELSIIEKFVSEANYIGEIGLDFNKQYYSSKEKQVEVFENIIRWCSEIGGKVISIHSVKSAQYVIDILERYSCTKNNFCILHWFTNTDKQLFRAINLGCYFSVNKKMIIAENGKKCISMLPSNKILIETDAPFTHDCNQSCDLQDGLLQTIIDISTLKKSDMSIIIKNNSEMIFK